MKLIVPEKIGFYSGVISSVFAMANLLGPLFGGIISDRTTWRWIFFIKCVNSVRLAFCLANYAVVRLCP
jgi:MFS family permease